MELFLIIAIIIFGLCVFAGLEKDLDNAFIIGVGGLCGVLVYFLMYR